MNGFNITREQTENGYKLEISGERANGVVHINGSSIIGSDLKYIGDSFTFEASKVEANNINIQEFFEFLGCTGFSVLADGAPFSVDTVRVSGGGLTTAKNTTLWFQSMEINSPVKKGEFPTDVDMCISQLTVRTEAAVVAMIMQDTLLFNSISFKRGNFADEVIITSDDVIDIVFKDKHIGEFPKGGQLESLDIKIVDKGFLSLLLKGMGFFINVLVVDFVRDGGYITNPQEVLEAVSQLIADPSEIRVVIDKGVYIYSKPDTDKPIKVEFSDKILSTRFGRLITL